MNRLIYCCVATMLALVAVPRIAAAQSSPGINPEDAVAPVSIVEGAGVKVGESTVLHPVIGMEAGVVSNVFFQDVNTVAAGLIRILGEVGTGSLSGQRIAPVERDDTDHPEQKNLGDFEWRADLRLSYDYYPSTNDNVRNQGGLGAGFNFRGIVNPERPVQFAVVENFAREIRPTNFESSDNVDRDINDLKLQLQYAPTGRSLFGVLHYENRIDVFEADRQQFANRFQNTLGLRLNYQWLPQTRLFVDVTQGIFTGIGSSTKVTSYPFIVTGGIYTLITPLTTLALRGGYTNGFYSSGPSFSAAVFGGQFGYRYSELGRVSFVYNYIHNDSINANYYRDHQFQFNIEHGFAPFLLVGEAEVMLRDYEGLIVASGPQVRNDVIGSVRAEVRYNFRDWLAATADYRFTVVSTDYMYDAGGGVIINPSYQRHEVLAGVRAAY